MKKLTFIHQNILKSEAKIQRLHHLIGSTFAKRDDNKQSYESWQSACANFHQNYSALVFHSDNFEGEENLGCSLMIARMVYTLESLPFAL